MNSAFETAEAQIPPIEDAELRRRMSCLRPLVRDSAGNLQTIVEPDPRSVSFIWDPTFLGLPHGEPEAIEIIPTFHSFGHPSLFKPSVAEVLAQVPEEFIGIARYFEVVAEDVQVLDRLHRANTILYSVRQSA